MAEKILSFEVIERKIRDQFVSTIAWDPVVGRQVFIKEPAPNLLQNEAFIKNFLEEGRRLARSQCPNVLTLYEFIPAAAENETCFMVLEYVDENLERILRKEKLSSDQVRRILRESLQALRVIHNAGFCHSNICPKSLLITPDKGVKLTNFRATWARTEAGTLELHLGRYSPHEVLEPGGEVGPWSDLYSLGCVIYECLVGSEEYGKALNCSEKRSPKDYSAKGAAFRSWHRELSVAAVPAHIRNPLVDPELSRIVCRMMDKDLKKRYRSADQILVELDQGPATADKSEKKKVVRKLGDTKITNSADLNLPPDITNSPLRDGVVLAGIVLLGLTLMGLIVY